MDDDNLLKFPCCLDKKCKTTMKSKGQKVKGKLMKKAGTEITLAVILCMVAGVCRANRFFSPAVDWDIGNARNWMRWTTVEKSIDYDGTEVATDTYDPQLTLDTAGHYTLHRDLTVLRCVADTGTNGKQLYFDFDDGVTFTARGMANGSQAFGMNGGVNILFALTGGTFLIPEAYCTGTSWGNGSTYASRMAFPRGPGTGERTTNVTFAVYNRTGATAALKTPLLQLRCGYNSLLVVSNNASATVGTLQLGDDLSMSNGVLVASGGLFTLTNSTGVLKIGGSSNGQCAHFTVANGGRLAGVDSFNLDAGKGHLLAFRGTGTDVTLPSISKSFLQGGGHSLEVTDGAHLTLAGGQGRIWVGNSVSHYSNRVYVAGAGTRLMCEGTGTFCGNGGSKYDSLTVTDGAYAEIRRFHIGQHEGSKGCVCRVDNGGVLVDKDVDSGAARGMIVGFGESSKYTVSNTMVVASGGIVSNQYMTVGTFTNCWDNTLEIDGGKMYTAGPVMAARQGYGSRLTVKNGGVLEAGGSLLTGSGGNQTNNLGRALSADCTIEVLSGGMISASEFICYGSNHTITVENGRLLAKTGNIQIPCYTGGDWSPTVNISGTNPVLRAGAVYHSGQYALAIRRDAKINIKVPQGGFKEPPFQTVEGRLGLFNTLADVPCTFDLSECSPGRPVYTVIAEAGNGAELYIPDDWLAKTRAALPEDARLVKTGGKLMFCYGNNGTMMIFR